MYRVHLRLKDGTVFTTRPFNDPTPIFGAKTHVTVRGTTIVARVEGVATNQNIDGQSVDVVTAVEEPD